MVKLLFFLEKKALKKKGLERISKEKETVRKNGFTVMVMQNAKSKVEA